MRRVRPRIYMIDCATTDLCSDEAIGRAIMRGVSVVLFGPPSREALMHERAARHDAEVVLTPPAPEPLGDALARAARKSG